MAAILLSIGLVGVVVGEKVDGAVAVPGAAAVPFEISKGSDGCCRLLVAESPAPPVIIVVAGKHVVWQKGDAGCPSAE